MKQIDLKPTARLAVKRNVLKKYTVDNQEVYFLKDGTEFEIELFNPTRDSVLCKIELNSNHAWNSEGLVLRPGERVFLERYLEKDRKFKFETYTVPDNQEAQNAIVENGNIKVSFFSPTIFYYNTPITYTASPSIFSPNIFYCADTFNLTGCSTTTGTVTGNFSVSSFASAEIETGIISEGNKSNQNFVYTNESFNSIPFHTERFKILPDSKKVLSTEDIKHKKYCSECGSKIKHTDKYCSNCGTKL